MYFNNAGWFLSTLYPSLIWSKKVEDKVIYLTFDDGPIAEITEYVLEELERFRAKATFFCVGDNITKHPEVFKKILMAGHETGNHTYNHLKGWKTEDAVYLENISMCEDAIRQMKQELQENSELAYPSPSIPLFRPPYGLIKRSQIRQMKDTYQIVMWDVLTGDFNKELTPEDCLKKAIRYTRKGSIVIFHDSVKAERNLRYVLPRYIEHFGSLGYRFEVL